MQALFLSAGLVSGMNIRREYRNSANKDGEGNVQEKNENVMLEIKKERRSICKTYIKNRRFEISFALFIVLSFCYCLHPAHELSHIFWLPILIIIAVPVCTLLLKEVSFINNFFKMEKNYYIWKSIEKNSLEWRNASWIFQISLDSFRRKLLSRVIGFKRNNIIFRGSVFDFRIIRLKKEIDIFFNFMIEFVFSKELLDTDVKKPDHDFEDFLKGFKEIFITHPESLNLVALNNVFRTSNASIKRECEETYNEIEKDVSEYYTKNEKLIEQRAERKVRWTELVLTNLLAIAIALAAAYIAYIAKIVLSP